MRRAAFFEGASEYFDLKRTYSRDTRWRKPIALVEGICQADEVTVLFSAFVGAIPSDRLHPRIMVSSSPDSDGNNFVRWAITNIHERPLYQPETGLLVARAVPILFVDGESAVPQDILLSLSDSTIPSKLGDWVLQTEVVLLQE